MVKTFEGKLLAKGLKFGIVVSRFNSFIGERLLEGAMDALRRNGAEEGDCAVAGKRFGMIRFGSRVDVIMHGNVELRVALGDKTVAGETVLAVVH